MKSLGTFDLTKNFRRLTADRRQNFTLPNIVVADTLTGAGLAPFNYFEYGYIGLPLLITTISNVAIPENQESGISIFPNR